MSRAMRFEQRTTCGMCGLLVQSCIGHPTRPSITNPAGQQR